MVDLGDLAPGDATGRRTFTVAREHTTHVFGEQDDPPARPAAHDAGPDEAVRVLGTPSLLAWVEFTARDSLHGLLPEGTGTAGVRAEVEHRRAAPLGTDLVVETELTDVSGSTLTFEGALSRAGDDADSPDGGGDGPDADVEGDPDAGKTRDGPVVGRATAVIRVVDRDRFRAGLSRG